MYCSELRSVLSHSLPSAYLKSYVLKLASFPANPCLAQVLPPPSRPLFRSCLPFAFYLKLPGTCNARILELSAHLCSLNELPRKEETTPLPAPLQEIRKMRAKSHIICLLQRKGPFRMWEGKSGYPISNPPPLPKSPLKRGSLRVLPQFSHSCWVPQAWTRVRWLMRANTGTLQIVASAVAGAAEPCWGALSCHAVA